MSFFADLFNTMRSASLYYCLVLYLVMAHTQVAAFDFATDPGEYPFEERVETQELRLTGAPDNPISSGDVQVFTPLAVMGVLLEPFFTLTDPAREAMLSTALLSLISSLPIVYKGLSDCPNGCNGGCVSILDSIAL